MKKEYIFSFYVKVEKIKLEKRKWWKIFSNDKIIKYKVWERRTINLNKSEADFISFLDLYDNVEPVVTIFNKLLYSGNIFAYATVQLEESCASTNYIKTNTTIL